MILSIYLDTCSAIYLVEEHPVYATIIEQMLLATDDVVLHHGCNALWTNDDRLVVAAPMIAVNVLKMSPF